MAIATALAVAGIAAAGSVAAGAMSSSAQKKAANQASQTAQNTANQNNALSREIYGQNQAALAPFQRRGNQAGDAINALLGLGGPDMQQIAPQQQYGQPQQFGGYSMGQEPLGNIGGGFSPQFAMQSSENPSAYMDMGGYSDQPQNAMVAPQNPQQDYNRAFQNYQDSTGYQFRVGEGVRALDSAASARGVRNSGAAQKALANYGQNIASGEFNNYLALLANQQGVGLSGASAQAGVGQNYVNNVTANNNSAGTAAANAQLLRGQSNANMWGNVGSAVGTLASSFGGGGGMNSSITNMFNKNPGIF